MTANSYCRIWKTVPAAISLVLFVLTTLSGADKYALKNNTRFSDATIQVVAMQNNSDIRWMRTQIHVPPTPLKSVREDLYFKSALQDIVHKNERVFATVLHWTAAEAGWYIYAEYTSPDSTHEKSTPVRTRPGEIVENIIEHVSDHHWRMNTRVVSTKQNNRMDDTIWKPPLRLVQSPQTHSTLYVKTSSVVAANWASVAFTANSVFSCQQLPNSNQTVIDNITFDGTRLIQWISTQIPQPCNTKIIPSGSSSIYIEYSTTMK